MKQFDKATEKRISKQLLEDVQQAAIMRGAIKRRKHRRQLGRGDTAIISKHTLSVIDKTAEIRNILYQRNESGGRNDKYDDTDLKAMLRNISKLKIDVLYLSGLAKGGKIIKAMSALLLIIERRIKLNIEEVRKRTRGKMVYVYDGDGNIIATDLVKPLFDWEENFNMFEVYVNVLKNRLALSIPSISDTIAGNRIMWHGSKRDLADLLHLLWQHRFIAPDESSERKFYEEFTKWFMDSDYRPMTDLRANKNDMQKHSESKFSYKKS